MKKITYLIIAIILAFIVFITPAAASTPQDVTILSDMSGWPNGTFEASGPAVEAGSICPTGTVVDYTASTAAGQGSVLILFVHKHFECSDGSGSFEMDLNVRLGSNGTYARWLIVSGSGAYGNLFGEGWVYATYTESGLYDTYSGKLDLH